MYECKYLVKAIPVIESDIEKSNQFGQCVSLLLYTCQLIPILSLGT